MKPPKFWFRSPERPGTLVRLLSPFEGIYAAGTARRLRRTEALKARIPVVSIGNVNLGGAGKTPTVISLIEGLTAMKRAPHVITRGYGGKIKGPHLVDARKDRAEDVGDEALLMSAFAPVWVDEKRRRAALSAPNQGADIILLDDALQNGAIRADLSLLVIDLGQGFGNGRILPLGPLRERVEVALRRVDHIVAIGDQSAWPPLLEKYPKLCDLPVSFANFAPVETGKAWDGARVYAFAGIGRPQKFYETLTNLGATLLKTRDFADHASYSRSILGRMLEEARAQNAELVTTEKDAVRLPEDFRKEILTLPVRLRFEERSLIERVEFLMRET